MHIIITYKKGSFYGEREELFDYTEVHYNFPNSFKPSVAFESDTLETGFTRFIEDIEQIEVFDD